jgi:hypothetical protein
MTAGGSTIGLANIPLPEPRGLDGWLADGWVDLDEEMDLADRAILASHDRDDALARLQETHRRAFEQAIRDKDEERLSKVAFWMDRAELCLDEMAKLREQCLGWSWEGQRAAAASGRTADSGDILS